MLTTIDGYLSLKTMLTFNEQTWQPRETFSNHEGVDIIIENH